MGDRDGKMRAMRHVTHTSRRSRRAKSLGGADEQELKAVAQLELLEETLEYVELSPATSGAVNDLLQKAASIRRSQELSGDQLVLLETLSRTAMETWRELSRPYVPNMVATFKAEFGDDAAEAFRRLVEAGCSPWRVLNYLDVAASVEPPSGEDRTTLTKHLRLADRLRQAVEGDSAMPGSSRVQHAMHLKALSEEYRTRLVQSDGRRSNGQQRIYLTVLEGHVLAATGRPHLDELAILLGQLGLESETLTGDHLSDRKRRYYKALFARLATNRTQRGAGSSE